MSTHTFIQAATSFSDRLVEGLLDNQAIAGDTITVGFGNEDKLCLLGFSRIQIIRNVYHTCKNGYTFLNRNLNRKVIDFGWKIVSNCYKGVSSV